MTALPTKQVVVSFRLGSNVPAGGKPAGSPKLAEETPQLAVGFLTPGGYPGVLPANFMIKG
jgi:hypothetical protein